MVLRRCKLVRGGTGRLRSRTGFSLAEMAIVMGVAGIFMAAIWAIAAEVWNSYRSYVTQQQLVNVVQNVRDYYGPIGRITQPGSSAPFGDGASITAALDDDDRRLIPAEMRIDPKTEGLGINHALVTRGGAANNGSFRVESLASGTQFRVRLLGLLKKNCMNLLMNFPVLMPEMGVSALGTQLGSTAVNLTNVSDPGGGILPMTLTTAQTWCAQETDNEVYFEFRLRN